MSLTHSTRFLLTVYIQNNFMWKKKKISDILKLRNVWQWITNILIVNLNRLANSQVEKRQMC